MALHYNTLRYHRRRAHMLLILGGKCAACDCTEGLEIHHRIPADKSFNISTEFSRPWPEILEELSKCELRCEAHHKEQHAAKHGLSMYSRHRCRCDICRAAVSEAGKRYKATYRAKQRAKINNNDGVYA